MPHETLVWIRRLIAIEQEYRVAHLAMRRLARDAGQKPDILDPDLRVRGISEALSNLESTYAIRVFAEFETGLRHFWSATRREAEPSRIAEIIDRIASRHGIGHDQRTNAHRVRAYRNRQVHDNEEDGETLTVVECRSFLNKFLTRLPLDWNPPT